MNLKRSMVFYCVICIFSCTNTNTNYKKVTKGNFIVEGNFINDSVMNGMMNYYDIKNNKLTTQSYYQNGEKNGISINYYSNGKVYDSVFYSHGLEDGFHYIFDSLGNISYIDYYSKGHNFGPEFYYLNGRISEYYFNTFEKSSFYSVFYDSLGKVSKESHNLNFVNPYSVEIDGKPALGVFAYFLNPPHINISYSLYLKDSVLSKDILIQKFDNSKVYVDTVLYLSNAISYYYKTEYFDSTNNKRKIIITKLMP
jgi:hypothetical protein